MPETYSNILEIHKKSLTVSGMNNPGINCIYCLSSNLSLVSHPPHAGLSSPSLTVDKFLHPPPLIFPLFHPVFPLSHSLIPILLPSYPLISTPHIHASPFTVSILIIWSEFHSFIGFLSLIENAPLGNSASSEAVADKCHVLFTLYCMSITRG